MQSSKKAQPNMRYLNMLLLTAKTIEIIAIVALILLMLIITWDLTEEVREERRKSRTLKRREERRAARTEQSQELAKARLDAATEQARARLRAQKEKEAHESFFNDNYPCGFDSEGNLIHGEWVIPTEKGREYLKEMDKISDDITMATTLSEEL